MWKLKNRLFGWDYVQWSNPYDAGIARVRIFKDGRLGYLKYRCMNIIDEITNPKQVNWLTCHPSKYLKDTEFKTN